MVVSGRRPEVAQTTLGADEVRVLPGAFGDPFRAVDMLPSATPIVSGLPYYYLRGAAPNNNAFYIDGVRVPLLYHVGIGAGVMHAGLIDQVDVFPSAPPANYGGVIGAIIAGQTRPASSHFHGEGNLRLIDVGTLIETPLGSSRRSLLVAGHYGYPGPILSAITPDARPRLLGLSGPGELARDGPGHAGRTGIRQPRLPRLGVAAERGLRLGFPPHRPALRPCARRRASEGGVDRRL